MYAGCPGFVDEVGRGSLTIAEEAEVAMNGTAVWRDMAEFDTSGAGVHPNGLDRFFASIVDDYLASARLTESRVETPTPLCSTRVASWLLCARSWNV